MILPINKKTFAKKESPTGADCCIIGVPPGAFASLQHKTNTVKIFF